MPEPSLTSSPPRPAPGGSRPTRSPSPWSTGSAGRCSTRSPSSCWPV